jgi:DUF3014 family protein
MSPEAQETRPPSTLKRSSNGILIVAALAIVAGGLWLLLGRGRPPETAPVVPAEPAPAAAADAAPAPEPATPPAPSDLRGWLEAASPNPTWRAWLASGDLLERWAGVIENVATGQSPRAHLPFLKPASRFSAEEVGGRKVIAPASYARYDGVADVAASLDSAALARAYKAVHGALDAAYAALGYPRGALDRATARALDRILAAPVLDKDVAVVDDSGIFVLEDPTLERLGEVEKHLLRMGPRNTRIIQAKARELRGALGLAAPVAPASAKGRR